MGESIGDGCGHSPSTIPDVSEDTVNRGGQAGQGEAPLPSQLLLRYTSPMRSLLWLLPSLLAAQTYDIVLERGRVMDPESGLDAVRNVALRAIRLPPFPRARCAAKWKSTPPAW